MTQIIITTRAENDTSHIPRDIEPVHHEQAEYIGSDGQNKGNVSPFSFHQFFRTETVDFTEDEDSQCRHQDGEAIHHAQYYQLVLQRHDAQGKKI